MMKIIAALDQVHLLIALRGVHFSGNSNNSSNAGLVYSNSNNSPTNANANISSHTILF